MRIVAQSGTHCKAAVEEVDSVGNAQRVVHFEAVVDKFAVNDAVGTVCHVSVILVPLYSVVFFGRACNFVDKAFGDYFHRRCIRLVAECAFVVVGVGHCRVAVEFGKLVCCGNLDVTAVVHSLDNTILVTVARHVGSQRDYVATACRVTDCAEAVFVAELEVVAVVVNVLYKVLYAVCACRRVCRGRTLRAGVKRKHHCTSARKFDAVLRHCRLGTRKAGQNKHNGRGIFFCGGVWHIHRYGVTADADVAVHVGFLADYVLFAVDFAFVVGQSHFSGQREVAYAYAEARRFETHRRKGKQENCHQCTAHHNEGRFAEKYLFSCFGCRFGCRCRRDFVGDNFIFKFAQICNFAQHKRNR